MNLLKKAHWAASAALIFLAATAGLGQPVTPQMFVTRSLSVDTINYEGGPPVNRTRVTLRAYGSGDSLTIGFPVDVIFVTDESGSMSTRNKGARNWINPTKIQGTYNATANFVDSILGINDRLAFIRFSHFSQIIHGYHTWGSDPGFVRAKDSLDTRILGQEFAEVGQPCGGGCTAVWDGVDTAITFAINNTRAGVTPIIILVTDGQDNGSAHTSAQVVSRLNTLNATSTVVRVFTINLGGAGDIAAMTAIATAGKGQYALSATGTDLDAIFQGIGQTIIDIAAVRVSPNTPMLIDVLGPNIHYVTGSYAVTTGANYIVPGFSTDVVNGLTRLKFTIDTVRLGKVMEVRYDLTAAITVPSPAPTLMRTNNSSGDDAANYSLVNYVNAEGDTVVKGTPKNSVWVKSGIGGLKLSLSATALLPPTTTGTIPLQYTVTTPAPYPSTASVDTFWYALIQLLGTNTAVYSQASGALWNFSPDPAWTALRFNNDVGGAKKVGVTASYDHAGSYPLRVQAVYNGVTYRDSVTFLATNATTENITRVGVDNDTTQPPATLDTLYITGNYSELTNPAFSRLLFSRGITNLGNSWPANAAWSASGFSLFNLSSSITGAGTSKLLTFGSTPPAYNNTPRNDVGLIQLSFNSLTGQMVVLIRDTTDYDTVESVVVVPDASYRSATDKNALYSLRGQNAFSTNAGDTLKFSGLLFDVLAGGSSGKFLGAGGFPYGGAQRITWSRNGSPMPGVDSTIAVTSGVPGSRDTLVAVWGGVRDTIYVSWTYGLQRFLRIESAPGVVATANAAPQDTFTFPTALSSDTAYAVVRDEFGYCVTNLPLEFWRMEPAPTGYFNFRSDSLMSVLALQKLASPASLQPFNLIAQLPPQSIEGVAVAQLEDTVVVRLVQYSYDAMEIEAFVSNHVLDSAFNCGVWNTQTYGIPASSYKRFQAINSDTVKMVALDDTVTLVARLHTSIGTWESQPVQWTLSNYAWQSQNPFPNSDKVTFRPLSRGNIVQLTATFPGGLTDMIYMLVEAPRIDTFLVTPPPTPVTAGVTVPLTIQAIDVVGNPVTDPTRVPTQVCFAVNGTVVIKVGTALDTVTNTTFCVDTPFVNGTLLTQLTSFVADTHQITVTVTYPGGQFIYDLTLPVIPGPPSSVVIVRKGDTSAVVTDTLSPIGTSTVREYEALVFDAYGNPITDPAVLAHLTWSMTGALPGGPQNLGSFSNTASYNAYGLTAGGLGTLTATYNFNSIVVTDNAQLYVIPLVGISYLSTHEWVMDTLSGLSTAEWVLREVGGADPATLVPGAGGSRNSLVSQELRTLGYRSFRDGFLDYLDIQLSDSLTLRESFLKSLWFSTIIRPGLSDAETLTVSWALTGSVGGRAVQSRLESLDLGKTKYRLWLLPNSVVSGSHLETGFKPHITFDNDAVRAANPSNPHPRLIGTGGALYTTSAGLVMDSAAPVIHKFLLQNNACNPSNPLNRVKITFSEPVKSSPGDITLTHSALALFNGASGDSAFIPQALTDVQGTIETVDPFLAWELDPASDFITLLSGTVKFAYNGLFTPNTSRIRFARDLTLTPVVDAAGNVGTVVANRDVTLENEKVFNEVCNLSGNTVVDRIEASTYSWIPVPGSTTEMAPGFPYFGFTVNLGLVDRTDQNVEVKTCAAQNFVVYDYDSAMAFVQTDVTVFDLFGNLVATPQSNPTLLKPYTVSEVRRYLGIDFSIVCGESSDSLEKKYDRRDAVNPADPDTLRPKYPGTFSVDYSFMVQNCGPGSAEKMCVPAWNALNLKGRLVAPGGYIAVQRIITPGHTEEVVRKLIVTSKERR